MAALRIAVLGKTGTGKSSLGNTIFGETVFDILDEADSGPSECKSETRDVDGRSITFIDTPGFFDTRMSEEEQKSEMAKCVTECSPGVHAFIILLKVERYTKQEEEVIEKIKQSFSEEAFKHAVLLFTHGDQLPGNLTIEEFVNKSERLRDLSNKCGGRCLVIDNKYWNNNQQDQYRNNQFQVKKLLTTVTGLVEENGGRSYTNEMLQAVERGIKEEEERIRSESGDMSDEEIRQRARRNVSSMLIMAAGITTGILLGALLGASAVFLLTVGQRRERVPRPARILPVRSTVCAGAAALGAAYGGYVGYREAVEADSAFEAAKNTAVALIETALRPIRMSLNTRSVAF